MSASSARRLAAASAATRWPRTPTTVTPVTIQERTWRSVAQQPELACLGTCLASGVATPPILEVSHSVPDAETDRKIQDGGHDGYVDQPY
jgi:hypothetical protein